MQQTSDTPTSTMWLIPEEVLLMILHHRMRSSAPGHLNNVLEMGRQFQNIRNETEISGTERDFENVFSEPIVSAYSDF